MHDYTATVTEHVLFTNYTVNLLTYSEKLGVHRVEAHSNQDAQWSGEIKQKQESHG